MIVKIFFHIKLMKLIKIILCYIYENRWNNDLFGIAREEESNVLQYNKQNKKNILNILSMSFFHISLEKNLITLTSVPKYISLKSSKFNKILHLENTCRVLRSLKLRNKSMYSNNLPSPRYAWI